MKSFHKLNKVHNNWLDSFNIRQIVVVVVGLSTKCSWLTQARDEGLHFTATGTNAHILYELNLNQPFCLSKGLAYGDTMMIKMR